MRRLSKLLLLLLGVLLSASASQASQVVFDRTSASVTLNNSLQISLLGTFSPASEGGGVNLSFNPSQLRITNITIDATSWPFFRQTGTLNNTAGTLTDLVFASDVARLGPVPIATITFQAIGTGTSSLQLTASALTPFGS